MPGQRRGKGDNLGPPNIRKPQEGSSGPVFPGAVISSCYVTTAISMEQVVLFQILSTAVQILEPSYQPAISPAAIGASATRAVCLGISSMVYSARSSRKNRPGHLQPLHRELGSAGGDDRGGHRSRHGARQELHPRADAPSDNGPQFIAKDFQRVHSDPGHDPRQELRPIIRNRTENRALTQIVQRRVHPARNAIVTGRCATSCGGLRRALQQRPLEQCHGLHHSEGHARRASARDSCRAGSEVGGGAKAAADSSPAGCVTNEKANLR